jgi:hypothetical protein
MSDASYANATLYGMFVMGVTIGDAERTGVDFHCEFSELEAFSKNFLAPSFLEAKRTDVAVAASAGLSG